MDGAVMNFIGSRDKDTDDLIKTAVLKFFGDEPNVHDQLLIDLTFPTPPAPAPEVLFEILAHLREFSQFFYGLFASLIAAYIFHRIRYKRDSKKFQEELEGKIREILQDNKEEIITHLDKNRDLSKRFKKVNLKKYYIRYRPDMKAIWEIRLKIYGEGAEMLLDLDETPKGIIEIFYEITHYDHDVT